MERACVQRVLRVYHRSSCQLPSQLLEQLLEVVSIRNRVINQVCYQRLLSACCCVTSRWIYKRVYILGIHRCVWLLFLLC